MAATSRSTLRWSIRTVFGHLLVESPELWIGKNQLLKDSRSRQSSFRAKCISASAPRRPQPIAHTDIVNQVRDLEAILVKKGMGASRLRVAIEEGGKHEEAAWSRRLPDALLFLYGQ